MSKGPQRIRGTQDIWGEEADRFHKVVETFDRVRRCYAFQRVETPVVELTEVFSRSIGETTDVVSKEMYTFERGDESWTLRPEFTAGICRAFLTEGWQQFIPMKLATYGPVFRAERPQKGRYRQFHQLDAEIIGTDAPAADVELLVLADQLLHELGISRRISLQLNTLGDPETRDAWRAALVAHFEKHRGDLSEDSLTRLDKNPLRILDSKDPRDRPIANAAPGIDNYMTRGAGLFFELVTEGLDRAGVKWTRNARLVRGLDYYRHTAFEFVTDDLGSQGTVLAGGRYDGLMESLGGPHMPSVGWAAGIERLAMMIEAPPREAVEIVVIPSNEDESFTIAMEILSLLRRAGIKSDMAYFGSENKRYEKARKSGASRALVVEAGDEFYVAATRIRDIDPSAKPVRKRLIEALMARFAVSDDPETRYITLEKRVK
ncbi:MAG TPA: histidine--tRNA ligase [Allosphingosinicella sp.]|nr:histidine--tRNA ligase [Allosphingosinicella sp.]